MLKHCCNSSVQASLSKGEIGGDPPELQAWVLWEALMQMLASVWLCSSGLSPPQTVFCTLLCNSLLVASEFGPEYILWAVRQVFDPGAWWGDLYYGGL